MKVRLTKPKPPVRPRGRPPKNPVTRVGVTTRTSGAGDRVGKESESLARLRESKTTPTQPSDDQQQVHQQIALAIQQSKPEVFLEVLPETASAYIDSPYTCGTCNTLLHGTRSVLICDGCGTGFHLRCLKFDDPSDIPEKYWYCTKCVAVYGGQPKASIYGPLRRGPGRRGSSTTWILKVILNELRKEFTCKAWMLSHCSCVTGFHYALTIHVRECISNRDLFPTQHNFMLLAADS